MASRRTLTRKERSELNHLAHKIAASVAQVIIESVCCPAASPKQKGWYDITSGPRELELADLTQAIRYLELLGVLEHHASNSNLIRIDNERQ